MCHKNQRKRIVARGYWIFIDLTHSKKKKISISMAKHQSYFGRIQKIWEMMYQLCWTARVNMLCRFHGSWSGQDVFSTPLIWLMMQILDWFCFYHFIINVYIKTQSSNGANSGHFLLWNKGFFLIHLSNNDCWGYLLS